jgi:hypothetical protein
MRRLLHLIVLMLAGSQSPQPQLSPQQIVQQRANHWIVSENAEFKAGCSAVAISKHALLTAHHCDLDNDTVSVDGAVGVAPDSKIYDQRDGMILVFEHANFKNVEPLKADDALPAQGESLYLFGNPRGIRNIFRVGVLAGVTQFSDDDIAPGSFIFVGTMNVEPGDSGSSIYASDGRRVGVVTYGIFGGKFVGFYPLTFTADQIRAAQ